MKKLQKKICLLTLLQLTFVASASSASFAADLPDCLSLLKTSCLQCHLETRICQKLEKKSKRAWKGTVKRMVRKGVRLDGKEQKVITLCLSEPSPAIMQYCQGTVPVKNQNK